MDRSPTCSRLIFPLLAVLLSTWSCGSETATTGSPPQRQPARQPPPSSELPAELAGQLDAWCEKVSLFAEMRGQELPVAEDIARELTTELPILRDAILAAGERKAALPSIVRRLDGEVGRSGEDGKAFLRASQLLSLYAAVNGGLDLGVFRRILWEPSADFRLRWQAAQAMAAADVDTTAIEFAGLISSDPSTGIDSPEQMLAVLEQAGYQDLAGFYIMVLRNAKADRLRNQAAFGARNLRDPRILPVLRETAEEDPHGYARINAAQSIAKLVGTPALPYLRRITRDYSRAAARGDVDSRFTDGFRYAVDDVANVGTGPLATHWKE
jgi:HEAT repeat protein